MITVWLLAFPKSFLNVGLSSKTVRNGAIANCKMNMATWLLQSPIGMQFRTSKRTAVQAKDGGACAGYYHAKGVAAISRWLSGSDATGRVRQAISRPRKGRSTLVGMPLPRLRQSHRPHAEHKIACPQIGAPPKKGNACVTSKFGCPENPLFRSTISHESFGRACPHHHVVMLNVPKIIEDSPEYVKIEIGSRVFYSDV
ncbi:hypothetical protein Mal33_40520 [Rosistilla oblonga]|uniref:Uncharacterized protein n=1 Tax=Rosistilla oblonga TaxID=2527990 RepID=A0A518IY67_9BACT|nr:hypothetical protein Mal33_40520 [Rosistilla oblonga]